MLDFLECIQTGPSIRSGRPFNERSGEYEQLRESAMSAAKLIALLSPRQREVLLAMQLGFLNKEIAAQLNIAEKTVKMHRAELKARLGTLTTPAAVGIAVAASFAPLFREASARGAS